MVVGTASTMVTARPEQSQTLTQPPDAPSPAQPQVSWALGRGSPLCHHYFMSRLFLEEQKN